MTAYTTLLENFEDRLKKGVFPETPENLYEPARYLLKVGGKRIRPLLCLLACELFKERNGAAYSAAIAIELFHNFTLMHDDIMDEAPLRRGQPSVHKKYGVNTAILSGDVMLVEAYAYLNKVEGSDKTAVFELFNTTAREVCEGQQLDADFEKLAPGQVSLSEYEEMISLKTAVLLAASLKLGGLIGGASDTDLNSLYLLGKNMGMAFQIRDDYLDTFGDSGKIGKRIGGDILSGKKTFLLLKAFETADRSQKEKINRLLNETEPEKKVEPMIRLFRELRVDQWAEELGAAYFQKANEYLEHIGVGEERKGELFGLLKRLQYRDA